MGKLRHALIVAVLTAVSTVALYFIFSAMFSLPQPASSQAGPIDGLFQAHIWMMALLFSVILVIILYSVVVFRRRPGDEEDGPHIHGNTLLEVLWTIVPTLVVVVFGVYGAVVLGDITAKQENEMVVSVTGRQWRWLFEYPEQEVTSGMLVLPVDQPILLELESADVIHSFWVPEFRVKQDLVPGFVNTLRITPTELGDFKLRCAEMCGTSHAEMLADVQVVSRQEFDQWIVDSQFRYSDLTPEERGRRFYEVDFGCNACHSLDGTATVGPTWQGLWMREEELTDGSTVVVDEEYIRSSILNPNEQIVAGFNPNVMPQDYGERFAAFEEQILQNEAAEINVIDDLIAFIRTLE